MRRSNRPAPDSTPGAADSRSAADPHRAAVLIRDARPADMENVQRIYAHHVLHGLASFEEVPPDLAEITRRYESVRECGLPYLVAEGDRDSGGRGVLGYAYATLYRTRSAYRFTLEDSIYIDDGLRGRGLGRLLLGELLARCAALPYRQIVAVIGDTGNTPSIALHAALGFQHAGVLRSVGFKFGHWVDTVLMQRPLGTGDTTLPPA
jgi:L-amino acid N-acyltransferase YncA